ncbi:MAG: hypothetical protein E7474_06095 [Ruminococcaceae bacterium]|nr:hypothetical protein [Oscillospiraceae bacterium]
MLDIRLELAQVNHQTCVEVLLPKLVEHCAAKAAPNELDRFLAALGQDAAPASCALLREMGVDDKDRLVVWLVAAHEERLRSSANRHLGELLGEPIVRIGRFSAVDRPGTRLALLASQVDVDYRKLLQSPLVGDGIESISKENSVLKSAAKLAVQMGMRLSPENLEKQGLLLLNSGRVKSRLTAVLQDAVRQEGLDVTVEDVVAERSAEIAAPSAPSGGEHVPDAFEQKLMEALREKARQLRGGGA